MSWDLTIRCIEFYNGPGQGTMNPYKVVLSMPDYIAPRDVCVTALSVVNQPQFKRSYVTCVVYAHYTGEETEIIVPITQYQRQWVNDDYVDTLVGTYNTTYRPPATGVGAVFTASLFSDLSDADIFSYISDPSAYIDASLSTTYGLNEAIQYFNTPDSPYMDIDLYTSGADGNKLITVDWDNITNIPAGMYPASYYVRIHADDDGQAGANLVTCPYKDKEYQITYQNALSQMFESEQAQAILHGWLYINVFLMHNDSDGATIDQSAHFKVFRDGSITDETDPGEGGNRDTHPNTSPRHNGEYADGTGSLTGDDAGQALSVDNILTTSYAVSEVNLGLFGDWLWSNDLQQTVFGNQVSPIENILSCKRIPFDVDTGTPTTIWLGNINSGVTANFAGTSTHKQSVGSLTIPMSCGGTFLDEQNNVSIYLPYCGIHSIPTSICYDKTLETITLPNGNTFDVPKLTPRTLTCEYVFDMIYGTCAALLYMDGSLFGVYNGSCGVDIPLTQSNRASNQLALNKDGGNMVTGIVTSTVGGMISGAMAGGLIGAGIGGLIGAGESALGGALRTKNNAVNQETHFTTSGGFSSQIASFMPSSVMVFVEYTDEGAGEQAFTDFEKVYAHENGFPCNLNLNMGDIVGYTELAGSIEIDSIPCLEEERVLLKQALQEGFYL